MSGEQKFVPVPGPLKYNADGLATKHAAAFRKDPRFQRAYAAGLATAQTRMPGIEVGWRVHVACWAAEQGMLRAGDFVEFGVFTGILSRAIVEYVDFGKAADRRFWLFDTFQGIDLTKVSAHEAPRARINNQTYAGDYYEEVAATFAPFPNVRLVRGPVPDTLAQADIKKIAYCSVDMNAAAPEIAAMEFAWERMVPGAIMLLDDYGWAGHAEQRFAHNDFAARRGVSILILPTGQGLIQKP